MLLLLRRGAGSVDRRGLMTLSFLPSSFSSSAANASSFSSSPELLAEPQAVIIALGGNMVSRIEVTARVSVSIDALDAQRQIKLDKKTGRRPRRDVRGPRPPPLPPRILQQQQQWRRAAAASDLVRACHLAPVRLKAGLRNRPAALRQRRRRSGDAAPASLIAPRPQGPRARRREGEG